MKTVKPALMALLLLLTGATGANAADICFELSTNGVWVWNAMINEPALMVGKAFGTLPSAGTCKDFNGLVNANRALWFKGQACGASNNVDISFFMNASEPVWRQFGYFYFPLQRDTLTTLGRLCTADTGGGGGGVCRDVNVEKVACSSPVVIPQGFDPTCPGVC